MRQRWYVPCNWCEARFGTTNDRLQPAELRRIYRAMAAHIETKHRGAKAVT